MAVENEREGLGRKERREKILLFFTV